jgi:NAD-reducing hydrogenase large subunit
MDALALARGYTLDMPSTGRRFAVVPLQLHVAGARKDGALDLYHGNLRALDADWRNVIFDGLDYSPKYHECWSRTCAPGPT